MCVCWCETAEGHEYERYTSNLNALSLVSVLSVAEPQFRAEERAGLSCSCNCRFCFKMKEDFSSLESIMHPMELLSIILSKLALTERTGYLLLFNLSEAQCSMPVHTAPQHAAAPTHNIIRFLTEDLMLRSYDLFDFLGR